MVGLLIYKTILMPQNTWTNETDNQQVKNYKYKFYMARKKKKKKVLNAKVFKAYIRIIHREHIL